ncbi:MAG: HlyD family secretion protein [Gammaproteobacteria bacterium]
MNARVVWLATVLLLAGCEEAGNGLPLVGTLERDRIEINAESWEVLSEILVAEGDLVQTGQVLMRQDPARAAVQLERAEANSQQAGRRLAELERGPRNEEIAEARARLAGAESQLVLEIREYERVSDLVARSLLSDSDLDRASNRRDQATASRDEARSRLEAMLEGTTIEEIDQARANLAQAQATLKDRRLTLDRLEIRATRDGLVEALPFKEGDRPRAGDVVVVMLAGKTAYARVYVPERLRVLVKPGLHATIRVDGLDALFDGQVRMVASEAAFTPYFSLTERDRSRLSYLAEVTLSDEAAADLPVGVPLEVDFPDLHDQGQR